MVQLAHRVLFGGMQAALLLRRHRRLLWGAAEAAAFWGDEPGPSPSPLPPSPSPMPPSPSPGPDDPDDPYDLPDDLVVPFILLAFFLVAMAGLMSGLTLGLMSLDQVDIEILRRSGTERQKRLAERIQPVLARPHVLLVTLLVCNALAAEALPLVLDRLADPVTAIIVSVTVVLFFGEIIPQAACSRYGLQIGAYSAPFVRALMFLTAPISYPIAWVLDRVLGHRHTALFRRAQLKALVDIHKEGQEFGGQLSADEVAIIKGALDLTHKTARNAMTPIDMVFMLPTDAVLDESNLTAIMASGHSRIPVHRPGDRSAILGIMLVKELLMVDKDQGRTVGQMKVRSMPAVRAETPLYDMLRLFEIGRSHMAMLMQLRPDAKERQRKQT
jgi:metal transporter CNNM